VRMRRLEKIVSVKRIRNVIVRAGKLSVGEYSAHVGRLTRNRTANGLQRNQNRGRPRTNESGGENRPCVKGSRRSGGTRGLEDYPAFALAFANAFSCGPTFALLQILPNTDALLL
jgi:hypothetical protein